MSRLRLEVTHVDDGVVETAVRERLFAHNVAATGFDDATMLIVSVHDGDVLVAGLYGWTWGGSAFVDLLWVDEDRRGAGLGSRVLAGAEEEARARGCGQVLLATHDFQAPQFYRSRGYEEVGRFENYPVGGYQVQLAKRLT